MEGKTSDAFPPTATLVLGTNFMEMVPLRPERKAELEAYAKEHGQSAADALDELLAAQLEASRLEYEEASAGIGEGLEDMEAGRVMSVKDAFEKLRLEHGFPG